MNKFAEGAAIGHSDNLIKSWANLLLGILTPTKPVSAVIFKGILSLFWKIKVKGPGQNYSAKRFKISSSCLSIFMHSLIYYREWQWTIRGSVRGLFFI